MGKDVKCGPGEAVWSILLALFHVPWPGASQGNCSTTTGSVANADSRAPRRATKPELLGVRARNFYFSQAFLSCALRSV